MWSHVVSCPQSEDRMEVANQKQSVSVEVVVKAQR